MNEKLTFTPCKVEKIGFDEQLDVIRTSENAKEGFSWWTNGDDEHWWN